MAHCLINTKYERGGIQVIRYKNETYNFNLLSQKILMILESSKKDLEVIGKSYYKEAKESFGLYEEVVTRIWNNENMYWLIHQLLYYKISKSSDCYFSTEQIMKILNINYRILEGLNLMGKNKEDLIKNAKDSGYHLRKDYTEKGAENKIPGQCYKLLNALKVRDTSRTVNIILNMYLYIERQAPNFVIEMLKSQEELQEYGYAFVAGLLPGKNTVEDRERED